MKVSRYRYAVFIMLLALVGTMVSAVPSVAASDCPSGQTQFKIDSRPSDGTYGDGTLTVTISDADEDSFNWSSNIEVESVMVKAGTSLKENPGGTSGTASSAINPSNGKPYGISHVSFCYSIDDDDDDEEEEEDDCEERNGGKECDSDEPDCPENGKGNGKGMGKDCEETLADVDKKPAKPADETGPGRVDSGPKPAPGSDVRGLRFSDRGDDSVAAQTAPQVRGREVSGRALPSTGATVLPYVLWGLGLMSAGTLLWRRRRQS